MEVQLFKCSWYPTKTALFCANTLAESVGLWPAVGGTTATARDCHSAMPGGFWQWEQTVSGQGCEQQGKAHLTQTQRGLWAGTGTHTGSKERLAMIPAEVHGWCGLWALTSITLVVMLLHQLLVQGNKPHFLATGLGCPYKITDTHTLRLSFRLHFLWCFWWHALHLVKKWQNLGTIHWFSKKKSQWHGVQCTVQLGLFLFIHEFQKINHRKENLLFSTTRSLSQAG